MKAYNELAQRALIELERQFPGMDLRLERVIKLGEEAGEAAGAALRCMDMTRRTGSIAELGEELADVIITAYCIAALFDIDVEHSVFTKAEKVFLRGFKTRD